MADTADTTFSLHDLPQEPSGQESTFKLSDLPQATAGQNGGTVPEAKPVTFNLSELPATPAPQAPAAPKPSGPPSPNGLDWARIGHGMNPGAYPTVRDYVTNALEDPNHPEHARAIQEIQNNPQLPKTLGFQVSPDAARQYGIAPTDQQGNPLRFAPQTIPTAILQEEPKPATPPLITLNRVDEQGNRTPMSATPEYMAAQEYVRSGAKAASDSWVTDYLRSMQEPLVDPKKLGDELDFLVGPFAIYRGAIKTAAAATTPENAAIALGTAGIGSLGIAGKVIQSGALAYFAGAGVYGGGKEAKAAYDAINQGDWDAGLEHLGIGGTQALLGLLAGRAAYRGSWDAYETFKKAQQADATLSGKAPGPTGPGAPAPGGGPPAGEAPLAGAPESGAAPGKPPLYKTTIDGVQATGADIQAAWDAARAKSPTAPSGARNFKEATLGDIEAAYAEWDGKPSGGPGGAHGPVGPEPITPTPSEPADTLQAHQIVDPRTGQVRTVYTETAEADPRLSPLLDSIIDAHDTLLERIDAATQERGPVELPPEPRGASEPMPEGLLRPGTEAPVTRAESVTPGATGPRVPEATAVEPQGAPETTDLGTLAAETDGMPAPAGPVATPVSHDTAAQMDAIAAKIRAHTSGEARLSNDELKATVDQGHKLYKTLDEPGKQLWQNTVGAAFLDAATQARGPVELPPEPRASGVSQAAVQAPITPATPIWELSPAQLLEHRREEALRMPEGEFPDVAKNPASWNAPRLAAMPNTELQGLLTLHGLPVSGTKAQMAQRLLAARDLRKQFAGKSAEDIAGKLNGTQIDATLRQLGAPLIGNKLAKAQTILGTIDAQKRKGESALAEYNFHRQLQQAVDAGQPVPPEVMQQYGIAEKPQQGVAQTPQQSADQTPVTSTTSTTSTTDAAAAGMPAEQPPTTTAAPASALPSHLQGAKPRYSYGPKAFSLNFANDLDKAAYIAAQEKRSKEDQQYVDFVRQQTGLEEAEVRRHGAGIKAAIKELAKVSKPGTPSKPKPLDVPAHQWPKRASVQSVAETPQVAGSEVVRSSAQVQRDLDNFRPSPGETPLQTTARKAALVAELMKASTADVGDDKALAEAAARIQRQRDAEKAAAAKKEQGTQTIDIAPATPTQTEGGNLPPGGGGEKKAPPEGMDPDEVRVREETLAKLRANPEHYLAEYTKRFGNVLNADDAATLFPEYNEDPMKYRVAVHPAATWIRDELFRRALEENVPDEKARVAFTAGSNAAGKSTALALTEAPDHSQVVFDSTFSNPEHARRLVEQALSAGRLVEVLYIRRPLDQALAGMLERADREGRVVTIRQLLNSDEGAATTVRSLWAEFADDPRFTFNFVDNSAGTPSLSTIELAAPQDYTGVGDHLHELLDAEYKAGRIPAAAYERIRGGKAGGAPASGGSTRTPGGGGSPQTGGAEAPAEGAGPGGVSAESSPLESPQPEPAQKTPSGDTVTPTSVRMSREDFAKEHTELPEILRNGTPEEREKEAAKQAQELKDVNAAAEKLPEARKPESQKSGPSNTEHEFSSTQLNLPADVAGQVRAFASSIPGGRLSAKTGNGEEQPHITLKYGNPSADPAPIQKALKGKSPVTVIFGKTSVFHTEDGDVLKIDVDSPELHRLNKEVGEAVEHTGNTFPTYKPHVTIAYLKKGEGAQYEGQEVPGVTGQKVILSAVTFSAKDGQQTDIPLGAEAAKGEPGSTAPLEKPEKEPTLESEQSHGEPKGKPAELPGEGGAGAPEGAPAENVPGAEGEREAGVNRPPHVGGVRRPARQAHAGPEQNSIRPGAGTGSRGGVSSGRRGSAAPGRKSQQRGSDFSRDYQLTDADHIGEGSTREKAEANVAAIGVLKQCEAEKRPATPEEQAILAKYTGWGASELSKVFDEPYYVPQNLKHIRKALDELLTPEEFKAAAGSTVNAHYTSPLVIGAMWDALRRMGMQGGERVLEPAMGVGNFFGLEPEDLREGSSRTGIELDPLTGGIAKLLYPGSHVHVAGFEDTPLANDFFDVAIGNVPFGNYGVADPEFRGHPALTSSIHNYFFAKALKKVRPGGVVAFITSSYTMDGQEARTVRKYLADQADLVGAIRLPETTFKENAGTEVTTDIIFLRKRAPGQEAAGEPWIERTEVKVDDKRPYATEGAKTPIFINEYFAKHRNMMLGKMTVSGGRYADAHTLEGTLTAKNLAKAVGELPADVLQSAVHEQEQEVRIPLTALPDANVVKDGGYVYQVGQFLVRHGNELVPAALNDNQARRVRGMLLVRDAWRNVLQKQEEGTDAEAAGARKLLNQAYDTFVRTNGPLSNRDNRRAFRGDPDAPGLLALEDYNEKTKTAKKADIFRKSTNVRYVPPETAPDAAGALAIALNEYGGINWPRIQQLTGLDREAAEKALVDAGLVYRNPEGGQVETADQYLSGKVRDKLKAAIAAAEMDPTYEPNVEALKRVQPDDLEPGDIDARLGATWIPKEVIQQFVEETLKVAGVKVGHAETIATWTLSARGNEGNATNKTEYGAYGWTGMDLVGDSLNLRLPTVRVQDPDDKDKTIVDPQATAALREKQQKLKDLFRKWIWQDPERAQRLGRLYNDGYNNLRLREFDGSHLQFPGMAAGINLRPHQKNAVWRMLQAGNALLAHVVGAGKTFEMVAAAMEMRRLGTARKPMIVVPNHLVEQWAAEFLRLYPNANIFVGGKETFAAGNRQEAMSRIANGNYDAVIVSHSSYGKLPVKDETFNSWIQGQIDDLEDAIREGRATEGKNSPTVKELEKAKKRLQAKLKKRAKRETKDKTITFEEMGIDQLFVDEAHAYKALYFQTKMGRVAGIPNRESDRAIDMYLKTQWLTKKRGGTGVVFATGTPISNTMAEMYTVMRYLQGQQLKETGLEHFDAWAQQYGETVTSLELAPSGKGYRMNSRFARFVNLPELATAFRVSADVQTAEMLNLPTPALKGGKPIIVAAEPTEALKKYVDSLVERAEKIKGKRVRKGADNMLKITGDGRKAALDMRLVDPSAADDPNGKVSLAVDKMYTIWKETTANRSTQLVFCDLSTPKAKGEHGYSAYDDARAKLIARGVPADQIAFIHDYDTDEQKKRLFDRVNDGQVRILFGSTEMMGVGMNVQKRLIALHHLDAPWRPSDIEQREGRILRQGNENPEVQIYRYVTKGSFDAYMWQILENKARFIAQVMRGKAGVRTAEDVEGAALTYAEIKGIASGDPRVIEKIKTDIEVRRLDALRSEYENQLYNMRLDAAGAPRAAEGLKVSLEQSEADLERRKNAPDEHWHIGGETFTGKDANIEAGAKLHGLLEEEAARLTAALHQVEADYRPRFTDLKASYEAAKEAAEAEGDAYVHGSKAAFKRAEQALQDLWTEYRAAKSAILDNPKPIRLGTYRGFELWTAKGYRGTTQNEQGAVGVNLANIAIRGDKSYHANTNSEGNPLGTLASIRYHVEGIDEDIQNISRDIERQERKLKDLKALIDRPFEYADQLKELLKRQERLNTELDLNKHDTQTQGEEAPEEEEPEPEKPGEEESDYLDPAAPREARPAGRRGETHWTEERGPAFSRAMPRITAEKLRLLTEPSPRKAEYAPPSARGGAPRPGEIVLWAMVKGKPLLSTPQPYVGSISHVDWLESEHLPTAGTAFDKLERGFIQVGPDYLRMRGYDDPEASKAVFTPQAVIDAFLQKYPKFRGYRTVDDSAVYALRQTPVNYNTSEEETVRDADAEYHPQGNYVALNWQAREVVRFFLSQMGQPKREWDATTQPLGFARQILARTEAAGDRLAPLAKALRQAAEAGEPVILVEVGPHRENWDETLREEQFHRAQMVAGGGEMITLSRGRMLALTAAPGGAAVERKLRSLGYTTDEMSYELPAHLARGPVFWQEAGIAAEQARHLLRLYFAAVEREHGKAVLNALRRALPEELNDLEIGRPLQQQPAGDRSQNTETGRGPEPGPDRGPAGIERPLQHSEEPDDHRPQRTGPDRANRPGTGEEGEPEPGSGKQGPVYSRAPQVAAAAAPTTRPKAAVQHVKGAVALGTPLLDSIVDTWDSARDDIRKNFHPTALSPDANTAGLSLREHAARAAQTFARAEKALEEARRYFSTRTWDENLDFINRVETGDPQPNQQLQKIADAMRGLLDSHREAVQKLGKNKLTTFYENYFPHLWKRGKEAEDVFRAIFGKRPIEGTKAFLKQRKFRSFQEGVDHGLVPVSENPVDLVLLKLKEMERYTLAHRFLEEMKSIGLAKFVSATSRKRAPEGWVKIPDQIGTVWAPPWVRIPEAHDKQFMDTLLGLANSLGMDVQRVAKLRSAWGRAYKGTNRVKTRFAGPESVILHEVGHLLDWRYNLGEQLVDNPTYREELRKLADLRLVGNDTRYFQQYVRRGEEKIANMIAAYGHSPARFQKVAPKTYAWFKNFVAAHPELAPLNQLKYGLQLDVQHTEYPVGGYIQTGNYYMPSGGAQIISNYLSPGLSGKPWYQVLRGASNTMLQFALGFSGFHAGFTTMDAAVSKLAIALQYLSAGKPLEAAKHAMLVPVAPVLNIIKGGRIRNAYLRAALEDPELAKYVEAIVEGGGRVTMDAQYRTNLRQAFMDAWRKHNVGTMALTGIPALAEAAMWPVLEWLVPRQKLGVFADMVDFELQRLGPNATQEQVRQAFSGAWNSVDNRMGQLVYDDLFWNRTVKDLMMITVQSVGWNLGTIREFGGAAFDTAHAARDIGGRIFHRGGGNGKGPTGGGGGGGGGPAAPGGRAPLFTRRMAYAVALVMLTGMMGAITDYVNTKGRRKPDGSIDDGHDRDWRDYFFPRTGNVDEQGHEERMALPGYLKDLVAYYMEPTNSVRNKLSPIVRVVAETLANRNFYDEKIWDGENDTIPENILNELKHTLGFFVPMSVSGVLREHQRGAGTWMQAGQMVGLRTAPSYITRTPAERYMAEYAAEHRAAYGTPSPASKIERDITRAIRAKDYDRAIDIAEKAVAAGKIGDKEIGRAMKAAETDPLTAAYDRLPLSNAVEAARLANPEERKILLPLLDKKVEREFKQLPPVEQQRLVDKMDRAGLLD